MLICLIEEGACFFLMGEQRHWRIGAEWGREQEEEEDGRTGQIQGRAGIPLGSRFRAWGETCSNEYCSIPTP